MEAETIFIEYNSKGFASYSSVHIYVYFGDRSVHHRCRVPFAVFPRDKRSLFKTGRRRDSHIFFTPTLLPIRTRYVCPCCRIYFDFFTMYTLQTPSNRVDYEKSFLPSSTVGITPTKGTTIFFLFSKFDLI